MNDDLELWGRPVERYVADHRRLHYWPEFKYLKPWLDIATKGLSSESKERANDEVAAHFHDAIDAATDAGLPEDGAVQQAIDSLGSPRKARRAFRRAYLTTFEDMNIRPLLAPRRGVMTIGFSLIASFLAWQLVTNNPQKSDFAWFVEAAGVLGIVISLPILQWVVPRLYHKGLERRAIAIAAIAQTLLWFSFIGMQLPLSLRLGHGGPQIALMVAVPLMFALCYVPMLRKLSNDPQQPA
jgi:hypothetical protein